MTLPLARESYRRVEGSYRPGEGTHRRVEGSYRPGEGTHRRVEGSYRPALRKSPAITLGNDKIGRKSKSVFFRNEEPTRGKAGNHEFHNDNNNKNIKNINNNKNVKNINSSIENKGGGSVDDDKHGEKKKGSKTASDPPTAPPEAAAAAPEVALPDNLNLPIIEPKESLISKMTAKSRQTSTKMITRTNEEPFQVWDKSGSLLSPAYMKGLTSRIVGNSQNLAEHKLLEVNLNLMRKQRSQVIHSWDARLKREQQILINNKAEWEMRKMKGRKKTAKAKVAIAKAKEALEEAMSRPINRVFIHRFTKAQPESLADLATARNFMAANIRLSLHRFKDILGRVGISGEAERKNAELLLQMRDHLEGLSSFEPEFLKRLQQSLPPDAPPAAFDILVDQIKANQREELLQEYEKAFLAYKKEGNGNGNANFVILNLNVNAAKFDFNDNNQTDAMKEAMAAVKREQVAAQLQNQSLLLQSHPFVTTAILLGKEIPFGYGGLGNKGEKKKDDVGEINVKRKKREDSMDVFGMDDDQAGMSSMRDVFTAMNMVDTKDVTDRIRVWLDRMESERAAAEELERTRKAAANRDAALAALADLHN